MLATLVSLAHQYEPQLVGLAGVICFLSCYTALTLIVRSGKPGKTSSDPWLIAAAIVTGCGIWATHYVALLAFRPGVPVGYSAGFAVLAAAIGIICSGLGFALVVRHRALLGGAMVGAAITAMNFACMASMRLPAHEHWNVLYLAVSFFIGVGFGAASLKLNQRWSHWWGELVAALLLVIGTLVAHFTGMAALHLVPDPALALPLQMIPPIWFSVAITAVCILILGLGVIGSLVHEHIDKLETMKRELEQTGRKLARAVETADAANAAKSQFLAAMSHELRTPLNAILGFSEMMKAPELAPVDNERVRAYAASIFDSGSHLLALINDILDISKFDAGQLGLNEEAIDVGEIVEACLNLVKVQAEKGGVRLGANVPDGFPALRADDRRLRQVLLNLLSNAVKFTPEGGSVEVSVSRRGDGVAISVSDTGIGMSAEEIPIALERFGQIDGTLSRKHSGTGLGLPISKHLVELHGGTLDVASELGIGTTVTVVLPSECVLPERKGARTANRAAGGVLVPAFIGTVAFG